MWNAENSNKGFLEIAFKYQPWSQVRDEERNSADRGWEAPRRGCGSDFRLSIFSSDPCGALPGDQMLPDLSRNVFVICILQACFFQILGLVVLALSFCFWWRVLHLRSNPRANTPFPPEDGLDHDLKVTLHKKAPQAAPKGKGLLHQPNVHERSRLRKNVSVSSALGC